MKNRFQSLPFKCTLQRYFPGVLPPFIRIPPPLCPAPKARAGVSRPPPLRVELTTSMYAVLKETLEVGYGLHSW